MIDMIKHAKEAVDAVDPVKINKDKPEWDGTKCRCVWDYSDMTTTQCNYCAEYVKRYLGDYLKQAEVKE